MMCLRYQGTYRCVYLLHVVGLVGGVGVDVLRHWADLPLLHDLDATGTRTISINPAKVKLK